MRLKTAAWGLVLLVGGMGGVPLVYPEGEMDGAFFKVSYHSAGVNFTASGLLGKGNSKGVCYTKLFFDGTEHIYTGPIACETAPGVWEITDNQFGLDSLADGTAIGDDDHIGFTNAEGHQVDGFSASQWTQKLDASGALKSATGKVLGSEACCDSTLDGVSKYVGRLNATAATVAADKVPQDARDLLDNFIP